MSAKIFAYKLVVDNGGAPCVFQNKLSLCICKPRIRQSAEKADWVIGFGGKSVPQLRDRLIYIAKINEKIEFKDYAQKYGNRPDCIYNYNGVAYHWKKGAKFHGPNSLAHDLGVAPKYDRAWCLLSDEFCYFGVKPTPNGLPQGVLNIYNSLPRDYKVNYEKSAYNTLSQYIGQFNFPCPQIGQPTHGNSTHRVCNKSEDEVVVYSCSSKR